MHFYFTSPHLYSHFKGSQKACHTVWPIMFPWMWLFVVCIIGVTQAAVSPFIPECLSTRICVCPLHSEDPIHREPHQNPPARLYLYSIHDRRMLMKPYDPSTPVLLEEKPPQEALLNSVYSRFQDYCASKFGCHWLPWVPKPRNQGFGEGRYQDDAGVSLPGGQRACSEDAE